MIKRMQKKLIHYYMVSDILTILGAFFFCFWLRFLSGVFPTPKGIPSLRQYLVVVPVLLLAHIIHFSYQGFYKIRLRRNRLDDLFLVVLNALVTVVLVVLVFSFFRSYSYVNFEISRLFLIIYGVFFILFIYLSRLYIFKLFRRVCLRKNGLSRIMIVGDGELGRLTGENLQKYSHFGLEVQGFLTRSRKKKSLGTFTEFEETIRKHRITDVFITLPLEDSKLIARLIRQANVLMVNVKLIPDIIYLASLRTGLEHIEGIPVINLDATPVSGWGLLFKRAFDILVSLAGILVFLPFGIIIALVIKLTSPGPVFYRQKRVGFDGRVFKMIKFRTMTRDAETGSDLRWSRPDRSKITGPGKILRKLSVDEIPQLINVLKGDMSLVGPRPERPEFVDQFKSHIPRYMYRHRIKTGMTGWAQVHGLRGDTSLKKRIEYDIFYIKNWSFRLDLQILWRTILKLKFIDRGEH